MKATNLSSKVLEIHEMPGKSRERLLGDLAVSPFFSNASTAQDFQSNTIGDLNLTQMVAALKDQVKETKANLGRAEDTLISQAVTLNSIFTELARRSAINMGQHLEAMDRYMRLALKAQSQCRATLETLAAIKNPPVVFAKQANIAHNQQVNQTVTNEEPAFTANTHASRTRAHVENSESPNELIEAKPNELDTRAPSTPSHANSELAAMG